MALILTKKKSIEKMGATLDSAGNYSIGGKDPTSPSGKSGTRYGATGYNPAADPNYRAPSGRSGKKDPQVSEVKAPKSGATTGSTPSWVTSGHELIDGKWVYTRPLSEGGKANLAAGSAGRPIIFDQNGTPMYAPTAPTTSTRITEEQKNAVVGNALGFRSPFGVGVGSGFGGGSGGEWGTETPKLEFSVLPGAKPGPMIVPSNSQSTQQSLLTGPNFSDKAFSKISDVSTRVGQFTGIVNEEGTGLDPTGVALNLGLAGAGGMIAKGLAKGVGAIGKGVTNIFKRGATKVDDVARMTDDVVRQVSKAPIAGRVGQIAGPVANTVMRTVARHPVISGLGALAVGTALTSSGGTQGGTAGTVRNAVPSTGETTGTEGTTNVSASRVADTGTTEATSAFDQQVSAMSAPSGGGSFVGGGSVGGGVGSGTGSMGGTAFRGEGTSEERAQAQAKAMQLARSQVDQAGVGAAPVGDQVDLANLQALRDKTKAMLDQYGSDAVTMPEFKANIQAMIAAGVENLKKLQPTPPIPVVETVEQEESVTSEEDRFQMDEVRKQLGMPDLESKRIDVMQQLQVVQETYQRVIDQIKGNPNLPKGLAARRLTEVFEDQKFASNQLLAQLEIIDQQLEDGNNEIDRQFGIFKYEQDQAQQAQARRADQLGYLIDSGAIAGMSDKEIRQWAAATGIPEQAIRQMKTNSLTPDTDYSVTYETNERTGEKFAIYTDKNDPTGEPQVVSLGNFGVKPTGTSTSKPNPLSMSEVRSFGLPLTFVGKPESEGVAFLQDISNSQPPQWFISDMTKGLTTETGRSFVLGAAQDKWDQYRSQYGKQDGVASQLEGVW